MKSRHIAPTVRIKKDESKKAKYRVYYRKSGKTVYLSSHTTKSGKNGAEAALAKAQRELDENYKADDKENVGIGRFSDHIPEFIKYCKEKKLAAATIEFYKEKLGFLESKLGRARLKSLDRNRVKIAIKSAGNGPTWERGILGALSAYMNWGYTRDIPLCQPSFTKFINLDNPKQPKHKNYFTIEEVEALMNHCKNDARRYPMALKFYAGIRTEELNRLTWDFVDFTARNIYVPESIGKTPGNMEELPDILWRWLEGAPKSGAIYKGQPKYLIKNITRYLKGFDEVRGATSRRTFATYASNAYGVEKTRKWMRHDSNLNTLEAKYIGCVAFRNGKPYIATKALSKRYFEN